MGRIALTGFAASSLAVAQNALAHTPPPMPPEPAQIEAARSFVEALPIVEHLMRTFPLRSGVRVELEQAFVSRAAALHPRTNFERIDYFIRVGVSARIDQHLPEIMPAVAEDLALSYARQFRFDELTASARFFGSPNGKAMAGHFVATDPAVGQALRPHLYRSIEAELPAIVREAEETERLRVRVNASRVRR